MDRNERDNWITSIEECADYIAGEIGYETVQSVLERYGARSIRGLRPYQYSEVFSELYAIEADLR